MQQPLSIALIDDHQILLDGIEALLTSRSDVSIDAKHLDGESLIADTSLSTYGLLIMDINMKGKDGIQVLQELKDKGFEGDCIFLSSYDDLKLVNEAMRIGAKGYVTKSNATEYLEAAIDSIIAGESYYSPDIKERILKAFTKSDDQAAEGSNEQGVLRQLTEREIEVLKLIASQYTSEEISKKLYIAKSTVDTHRKNLIYKLKVKNAVGLGLFAERNGLI